MTKAAHRAMSCFFDIYRNNELKSTDEPACCPALVGDMLCPPGKGKPKSVGESHLPLSPDPYPFRLSR